MHFLLMQPLKNRVYSIQRNEARLFKNYMEMCGTEQQNDGHQFTTNCTQRSNIIIWKDNSKQKC